MKASAPFTLILPLVMLVSGLAQALEPIDHIVAVANEDIVLSSELDASVADVRRRLTAQGVDAPPTRVLREQVLERLIVTRLQVQRAAQMGIAVDDDELNQTLESIAARNGMTLSQFARALRADGMDYLQVRQQVRDEMLTTQLRQREVESRIIVTEQDIELFLNDRNSALADQQFRLSHILISAGREGDTEARAEARKEAEQVLARIRAGEPFAELAVAHSDGQTALQGGDLGWREGGALPTIFADVAPALSVGETSDLIETRGGFHLIKLVEQKGGEPKQLVTETLARHILLQPNAIRNEKETEALAGEIYRRLQAGEAFDALARQYSDDTGSANTGGDLGWQPEGSFVPAFEKTLGQLDANELSKPFRSSFGWHIAQLLDRRERDSTEQIRRARARDAIRQRKMAEEYELWIRRLRDEAYVEYRLEPNELPPATADS